MAQIINQAVHPLLVSDSSGLNPGNVVSLSYLLDSKVQLQLVNNFNIPHVPDGFSDMFVFNPSDKLRDGLEKDQNYKLEPVYENGRYHLWRLEKQ